MAVRRSVPILVVLAFGWTAPGVAQSSPARCGEKRPLAATAQTLAINYAVNRFDGLVLGADWAATGFESWSRNLRLGWEWDENAFGTNMFMHPQHGGLYFNAGRANCLDFWESVPLAFLGSWTWEYFGETHRPSLNDFFMTSLGGIALGEILHRVSTTIRDNELSGGPRLSRELAAAVFDPVGAVNRLVRGDWSRTGPNPPEHDPGAHMLRLAAGTRRVREAGQPAKYSGTLLAELTYGDPFNRPYAAPFDAFSVRLQVSPGGGGLNMLRGVGRLYGGSLTDSAAAHQHRWTINQRFDYVSNPVYRFGEQAVEVGVLSSWRLGRGGFRLRTEALAAATLLGAIDGQATGSGERDYDFGPGLGANVELALERRGVSYLTFYNRLRLLGTVSGPPTGHDVLFTGLAAMVPVARGLGVGVYLSEDRRTSRYPDLPPDRRSYLEGRIFLTWSDGRPTLPAPPQ